MTTGDAWWSPWQEADEAFLLHVDLRPDAAREERALGILDEREQARWNRFVDKVALSRQSRCVPAPAMQPNTPIRSTERGRKTRRTPP